MRGGTYYAFQPGNDVREYGAELAVRYVREQRAMLANGRLGARPWKCLASENARVYRALSDEFFGGLDATPARE